MTILDLETNDLNEIAKKILDSVGDKHDRYPCILKNSEFEKIFKEIYQSNDIKKMEKLLLSVIVSTHYRRPHSTAEKYYPNLIKTCFDKIHFLKINNIKLSNDFYKSFINIRRIYGEYLHIEDSLRKNTDNRWIELYEEILDSFDDFLYFELLIYNLWVEEYPYSVEILPLDTLKFIIEYLDDDEFQIFLLNLSKTKNQTVLDLIDYYREDDEEIIRDIANKCRNNSLKKIPIHTKISNLFK